jgi:hypothetical protein
MVSQILVEESVLGWEELELEVVRDAKGQKITVCFIENVDAMGVHTGDSYCTAPMMTIAPELQQKLQKYSYDIVDAIEVIGETNVQLAHDPETGRAVGKQEELLLSRSIRGLHDHPHWLRKQLDFRSPWYLHCSPAALHSMRYPIGGTEHSKNTHHRATM